MAFFVCLFCLFSPLRHVDIVVTLFGIASDVLSLQQEIDDGLHVSCAGGKPLRSDREDFFHQLGVLKDPLLLHQSDDDALKENASLFGQVRLSATAALLFALGFSKDLTPSPTATKARE